MENSKNQEPQMAKPTLNKELENFFNLNKKDPKTEEEKSQLARIVSTYLHFAIEMESTFKLYCHRIITPSRFVEGINELIEISMEEAMKINKEIKNPE